MSPLHHKQIPHPHSVSLPQFLIWETYSYYGSLQGFLEEQECSRKLELFNQMILYLRFPSSDTQALTLEHQ